MSNGPILYPPVKPEFIESVVKVTANSDVLDLTKVVYDTDIGGIYNGSTIAVPGTFQKWTIEWPLQVDATGINIYAGFSPTSLRKVTAVAPLPGGSTSAVIVPPLVLSTSQVLPYVSVPQDARPYVNVSKILADTTEVMLQANPATEETGINDLKTGFNPIPVSQDFPITDPINKFHRYAYEEIRRRHIAQLSFAGEDAILFTRRWAGTPCQCVDDDASDPDYQARGRCVLCFGTGIFAGYYLGIPLKMRYAAMPVRKIRYDATGVTVEHRPDFWTLWEPRVHEHDILVRVKTGEKFEITDVQQSEFRGLPLHQNAKLTNINPNDMRSMVTDAAISQGLLKEGQYGFARYGWGLFS